MRFFQNSFGGDCRKIPKTVQRIWYCRRLSNGTNLPLIKRKLSRMINFLRVLQQIYSKYGKRNCLFLQTSNLKWASRTSAISWADLQTTWSNYFQPLANITMSSVSDITGDLEPPSELKKTLEKSKYLVKGTSGFLRASCIVH